jgi:hypothetical protein
MLMSPHDSGVEHHVFVVMVAGQQPENALENAALGPSAKTLVSIGIRSGPWIGIQKGPPFLRFERLALVRSELVGVAETGRAQVGV